MNEIIKNIEAAQLKAEVPAFNTGDTVRVHALIKEGNRERPTTIYWNFKGNCPAVPRF